MRLVDPHLVATFPSSTYTEAQLWVTVELVNTASAKIKATISVSATLEDQESLGTSTISATQVVEVNAKSTLQYSLFPVCDKYSPPKTRYGEHELRIELHTAFQYTYTYQHKQHCLITSMWV